MNKPSSGASPGAGPMANGPSSPRGDLSSANHMLQAQAKILAAALEPLLPKQPSIAIGAQPICGKVLPTDTSRASVVMVNDPTKDGLVFLTGQQTATGPTTAHCTAARLLQEQLSMCYGPDAVEFLVTSPVDKMGVVTQFFILSLPLIFCDNNIEPSGPSAHRAIDASAMSHDLATNPRVIVLIMHEPREVTAVAIPGSTPIRYRIPHGEPVPWEPLLASRP